jgi:hypothetical protein
LGQNGRRRFYFQGRRQFIIRPAGWETMAGQHRDCQLLGRLFQGFIRLQKLLYHHLQGGRGLGGRFAHRYESGSLLITSNHPFSTRDSIFPDNRMAVAAVDRLIHHADIIELTGESYRKRAHATRRKEE